MGTPDFSVPILESLAQSHHRVVAVYTRPDRPTGRGRHPEPSPVKRAALAARIPVIEPQSLSGEASARELSALKPDLIVVAALAYLLPPGILKIPPHGCLNVHPSLLPRHRGPSPVVSALLQGDTETGVSIMLMDEGLDTGPVLSRRSVDIDDDDTTGSLTSRLAEVGARLLVDTIPLWLDGSLSPQPQRQEDATYTARVLAQDGRLDWSLPAVTLWRQVRAYHPWPGSYTYWRGQRLKVHSALPIAHESSQPPGTVIHLKPSGDLSVGVQTGDGVLGLRRIQLEGKREVTAEEFIRGHRDFAGSLLGS